MMPRTFNLLLGCIWLSLGVASMAVEPQPELWIESNHPHAPWSNLTLLCRSPSRVSSKFLLMKDNTQMTWTRSSYKTFQVSFFIGALSESTTGVYRCCYWKEKGWSKPSKVLELQSPGQLPKPIFWIEAKAPPLPGCNVNILCDGWIQDLVFVLLKEGNTEPVDYQVPTGTMAIFSIDNLAPENEGVYLCRTHFQMLPTLWSEPSNPLKLVVAGLYPKPTLTAHPGPILAPGESLSFRCQGPIYGMTFVLMRLEGLKKSSYYKKAVKNEAYFDFKSLKTQDTGHYLCLYYDASYRGSLLSDILKVWVTETFPKTWLLVQPSPVIQMGQNVSLRCQGLMDGVGLALYKKEEEGPLQILDGTSNDGNKSFLLTNVTDKDAGIYSCLYFLNWKTSIKMETYNTVELMVVAWPSSVFNIGKTITFQCRVFHPVLEFSLEWEEKATFPKFSINGDFIITNIEGQGTGTYSCIFRIEAHTDICSDHSKPPKLAGPRVTGFLTWNSFMNEVFRMSLFVQLISLLLLVLWIRWRCRRLRLSNSSHLISGLVREAWLLGTAQGVAMLFIIMALLCCGLCTGALAEEIEVIMPTPKPELWAETNFPLAPWTNLTLWCRSPSGSTKEFVLLKDGTGWIATRPASEQVRAAFPLGALTHSHTGSYHCHSWEEMAVSEPSEALELVGTDILPKPVISASLPVRGQELQIRCKGWLEGLGFALFKKGEQEPVQQLGAIGREAFFTIQRMEDKDQGNYSCRTHTQMQPFKWSEPSEPLELVIKETYPKPFFKTWASPVVAPGARVTFNCSTSHEHMSFILYKDDTEIASSDPAWGKPGSSAAHFLIISVGIGDGGNYSCRYYDFSIWSEPSDPVELIVTEFYPKPTLLAQPGPVVLPGKNVTLRCQGIFQAMRFALLQEGTHAPIQFQSASGTSVDFLLHTVGAEDSGNYSCIYYETTMSNRGSYPSTPLMIWVTDTFPRPWLSAEPSSVVTMGQNVTLWCQGPVHGVGYILHKEGKATSMQLWGSTSNEGAFPITNISGASIGRYSCCYHPDWISSIKIQPSNTLELMVTGLLPKPSLLVQPGPMVAPGENVTLQCQGELPDSTFVLLKEGNQQPLQQQRPSGYRADFWMPVVRDQDSGVYSCVYYLDSAPLVASNHSNSLEIWVSDKPPKPSLSAWPSTVFKLGKDITLQCRGPLPGVEFVLEHDGEEAPQQFSEDGDFVINNLEGKGIGNYSCSYRLQDYPNIWSEPSDAVELVGAAGPVAQECTVGNIVRSTLIVVVVVALGIVLAVEWKKWPRLRTRGSETDGRDQTVVLEECNQEGEAGTTTNSPSSASPGISVEVTVPI
ncbi:immunoglobulin superfamily member 1 isoform X1 [Microtus oregoni]|uniref:immunoglobulin superfamily member 1 isoform X1 n=1 Tax=Microtus oregoni TaxID=111838 RepID=UPI001BB22362|nr:immunoglobulin superfamily member 1 isoform X1 [Microtus oregoni]XP_041498816.1 immunoglobulin superfamily member 1 isoform X1 [Microtus oregoni]